jgi:hypothetical protein
MMRCKSGSAIDGVRADSAPAIQDVVLGSAIMPTAAVGRHLEATARRGPVNCDPNNPLPHSATGIIPDLNHSETRRHCRASRADYVQTVGLSLQPIHSATPPLVSGLGSRLASM